MLMLINDEVDDVDAWVNPGANGAKPNHSEKIGLSAIRQQLASCTLVIDGHIS